MKLIALMNPWHDLKIATDSTIACLQDAQKRGWHTAFFTINNIFVKQGEVYAKCHNIDGSLLGEELLESWDIILFRQDPPIDLQYLYATQLLDLVAAKGVKIVNNPRAIRDFNEKLFILQFPQCIPETLVSANRKILLDFWQKEKQVIFKPLHGLAGMGIFYVDESGINLPVILDTLTNNGTQCIMAQRYIPEILTTGDRRIMLIGGKPVKHVLARIPSSGDIRGNIAAGARWEVRLLNEHEHWLCQQVGPILKNLGLDFVGIDVIGGYITEINITSPTGALEIRDAGVEDIIGDFLDYLVANYH